MSPKKDVPPTESVTSLRRGGIDRRFSLGLIVSQSLLDIYLYSTSKSAGFIVRSGFGKELFSKLSKRLGKHGIDSFPR